MQESFWRWQCSDRYIISLSPPPSILSSPLFFPSLISLMVFVDVKRHVYLLTYTHARTRTYVVSLQPFLAQSSFGLSSLLFLCSVSFGVSTLLFLFSVSFGLSTLLFLCSVSFGLSTLLFVFCVIRPVRSIISAFCVIRPVRSIISVFCVTDKLTVECVRY